MVANGTWRLLKLSCGVEPKVDGPKMPDNSSIYWTTEHPAWLQAYADQVLKIAPLNKLCIRKSEADVTMRRENISIYWTAEYSVWLQVYADQGIKVASLGE